jgi:hypothetical protein
MLIWDGPLQQNAADPFQGALSSQPGLEVCDLEPVTKLWLWWLVIAVTECYATILLSFPHANATAIVAGVKACVVLHHYFHTLCRRRRRRRRLSKGKQAKNKQPQTRQLDGRR